jgi:deoxyribonuclease V
MTHGLLACVDVDYRPAGAVAACVCFRAWSDDTPVSESVVQIRDVAPYQSGQFYRRELPCILAVLQSLSELPAVVIVDGYVWLGEHQPGLGAHLYEALRRQVAVIGMAKTRFVRARPVEAILRGRSRSPLYVTAAGMDAAEAASHIRTMPGPYRIPTLLKRVDRLSRGQTVFDSDSD